MNICYDDANGSTYDWTQLVIAGLVNYMYYVDGSSTYKYHCFGIPGKALTDSAWCIRRETVANGRIQFAGGKVSPYYAATNLILLETYSYI